MASLDDFLTPLAEVLASVAPAGGPAADAVFTFGIADSQSLKANTWTITVPTDGRVVERHTGRYREAITARCQFVAGDVARNRKPALERAAAMLQAAVVALNSPSNLVLAAGLLVSDVNPLSTAGSVEFDGATLAVSDLEITATRWVLYGD